MLDRTVAPSERARPATGLRDLEAMQRFASGSGPFAFFDAPWTPIFLFALFTFHWMLGLLAVCSGVLLLIVALLNQLGTSKLQIEAGEATARSGHYVEQMRAGSETVRGLAMHDAVISHSRHLRDEQLDRSLLLSDRSGLFGVTSKTLRLLLRSMMLGLSAGPRAPGSAAALPRRISKHRLVISSGPVHSATSGRPMAPPAAPQKTWSGLSFAVEEKTPSARDSAPGALRAALPGAAAAPFAGPAERVFFSSGQGVRVGPGALLRDTRSGRQTDRFQRPRVAVRPALGALRPSDNDRSAAPQRACE